MIAIHNEERQMANPCLTHEKVLNYQPMFSDQLDFLFMSLASKNLRSTFGHSVTGNVLIMLQ